MIRAVHDIEMSPSVIDVLEETDPIELEKARLQRAQFDRNSAWLEAHIKDVYVPGNRGKVVAIAGEQAFVGDTVKEAVAKANAAHPDDRGYFTRYIPKRKMIWVYAT
jgi:hypothetical protein